MPDQNNPTDTNPTQVIPPVSDTSPVPMDIPPADASIPPPFPTESSPIEGVPPTFDMPPVVTPVGKPKFGGKRVIATILGLLVLVGGLGAGLILVRQQQDIREKAAFTKNGGGGGSGTCTSGQNKNCTNLLGSRNCPGKQYCTPEGKWDSACVDISGDNCPTFSSPGGVADGECAAPGDLCASGKSYFDSSCPEKTRCGTKTGGAKCTVKAGGVNSACVGNVPTGPCYQGGQGNQYACYKLKGNPGIEVGGENCSSCPPDGYGKYTWFNREYEKNWCFNTAIINCDGVSPYAERCSLQPQKCPTSPPGDGGPTAQCLDIKAFDTNWNQLTTDQLKLLKSGDKVRFTVAGQASSGNFDKARFKINGVQRPEVTGKRPATEEYFDEYTIPEGITTFSISAQIHHTTLDWSN